MKYTKKVSKILQEIYDKISEEKKKREKIDEETDIKLKEIATAKEQEIEYIKNNLKLKKERTSEEIGVLREKLKKGEILNG
jgi:DNA-binding transcriptional regulator YiaG